MNKKLVSQGLSAFALIFITFGFFFALGIGSLPLALLQAGLFGLNVFAAIKNKTFSN